MYNISSAKSASPIISASVEDIAMACCRRDPCDTHALASLMTYPVVDLRTSQLLSERPLKRLESG